MSITASRTLPSLAQQADRLIELGIHQMTELSASDLRATVADIEADDALLVLHPDHVPATKLAPLIELGGKHGFVVVDMPDADDFQPIEAAAPPSGDAYLVHGLDRGDHLANWSPD